MWVVFRITLMKTPGFSTVWLCYRGKYRFNYPGEPKGNLARHLNTLAGLISGIVGSKSTSLPVIAAKVPDGTKRERRVRRFSRWTNNEGIDAEIYFLLYADALLQSLAHSTLLLAMDGSEVGRRCLALTVSVIYKKRALPIAWIVVRGSSRYTKVFNFC